MELWKDKTKQKKANQPWPKNSDSCLIRSLIDWCFEVTKLIQGSDCWNKPQAWQRIRGVSRWITQCVSAVHAALEGPFVFPASWIWEQLPPTLSPQTITFHCFHCMCGHHGLQPGPAHVWVLTILWWKGDRESDTKCKNAAQVKQDKTSWCFTLTERSEDVCFSSQEHDPDRDSLPEPGVIPGRREEEPRCPRVSVCQQLQRFIHHMISGSSFLSPLVWIHTVCWDTLISVLFKTWQRWETL